MTENSIRVGLDVRMIENSGIGTTIRELLDHWDETQKKHLTLFGSFDWTESCPSVRVKVSFPIYSLRQHWEYPRILNSHPLTFFHMPHYDVPLGYKKPFVATVHDLIHVLFPQYSTKPFSRIYSQFLLKHVAKNAKRIIVVSENTKKDLLQLFPEAASKTVRIYSCVDSNFQPIEGYLRQQTLKKYNLKQGYLLYVGNLRKSKNTMGLLKVYEMLRFMRSFCPDLVLVGKNFYPEFKKGIFQKGVRHIGSVDREDLPALYSGASLFVFPSLYEGFGLPPLEAMACGTPVAVSNVASLPEVCGEAAAYFDPNSTQDVVKKINELLDLTSARKKLVEKGFENIKRFDLKKYAADVWNLYEEVAKECDQAPPLVLFSRRGSTP